MKSSFTLKHLTVLALFTTIALAIYSVETALPTLIPIPGIKLGLANIITLIVLKNYSAKDAFLVLLVRILLATFFFGQAISLLYSLVGGFLCLLVMYLVNKLLHGQFIFITSIFGALAHQMGQLTVACLLTASLAPVSYLPFFIISGTVTGLFTGLCAHFAQKYLNQILRGQFS